MAADDPLVDCIAVAISDYMRYQQVSSMYPSLQEAIAERLRERGYVAQDRVGVESDANLSPRALKSTTLTLTCMRSIAGDMWDELENLRQHWQGTEREAFIQDAIDRYEKEAI